MARQFAEVVKDLAGGRTYEELTGALAEVVQAVIETRKVGSVAMTLKIKPNGEGSVIITDQIKTTIPEKSRGETIFFTLSDGSLRRDDPAQQRLPLRDVGEDTADELREVS